MFEVIGRVVVTVLLIVIAVVSLASAGAIWKL